MSDEKKPHREFWVEGRVAHNGPFPQAIHVIEYSAYEKLLAELMEAKQVCLKNYSQVKTERERADFYRSQLDVAVSALENGRKRSQYMWSSGPNYNEQDWKTKVQFNFVNLP